MTARCLTLRRIECEGGLGGFFSPMFLSFSAPPIPSSFSIPTHGRDIRPGGWADHLGCLWVEHGGALAFT